MSLAWRLILGGYLVALGALCAVAYFAMHGLMPAALLTGLFCVPLGLWRFIQRDPVAEVPAPPQPVSEVDQQRETRLEAATNGAAVGLALLDTSGSIVQANPAFGRLLGYSPEALVGKTLDSLTLEPDVEVDRGSWNELVAGGRAGYTIEKRLVRQDTQMVYASLTYAPVGNVAGAPEYVTATVQDVAETKQRGGGAIQDTEQVFRRTFDQAAVGIGHTGKDGRLSFANRRLGEMLGRRRDDLLGVELLSLLHPEDAPVLEEAYGRLLSGDLAEYSKELRLGRRDGSYLWGHLTMSLVRDLSGAAKQGIVLVEDVTEQKETREKLVESEERYRLITETASDAILTLDGSGTIRFANAAASQIFGYAEEELSGRSFSSLLTEEARGSYLADPRNYIRGSAADGNHTTTEAPGLHRDGHALALEIAFTKSIRGDEAFYTGVIRDITARRQAEQERAELQAREQEARAMAEAATVIRGVVEASPLPIITLAPDGNVVSWNRAATRTFGWEEAEVRGTPVPFPLEEGQESESVEFRERALAGESITNLEVKRQARDGSEMDLFMSTAPVRDAHGAITGIMFVYADITARKRMEVALAQARDQALESSRLKSEFLATMSHEIRTPMNGIIGMIELLLDTPLDEEQTEYINVVGNSAQHLLSIINDILDFSKMEADKIVLDSADFEPLDVIEGAAELMGPRAREKALSLVTHIDPNVPGHLIGDPSRLRQVLLNLIGNAIKFTEKGEVVISATLLSKNETDAKLRFAVSDTGIGLTDEARKRLFQPFVQADGSTTRKYGGTGLGLAICKRLSELMGGEIGVESNEDEGSTFWFTGRFPLSTVKSESVPPIGNLNGIKVLLVEDRGKTRDLVRQMLLSWGMRVDEAATGRVALERLMQARATQPYDLVITDYSLPDMDALQLLQAMRGSPTLSDAKAIILTAHDSRGQGEKAVAVGFSAYLTKPARWAHLRSTIVEVLNATGTPLIDTAPEPEPAFAEPEVETHDDVPVVPVARSSAIILVVEDNVNNQIMAMRQLEKLGFNVRIVSNGAQAVKAVEFTRYDLIFMDCQMPEMDGFEATRHIRESEAKTGRHTPIVAMTANAMDGDRQRCLEAGMDDYIAKPVSRHMLREALDRWLAAGSASVGSVAAH